MKVYEIISKKYGKINVLLDDDDYERVIKEKYSLSVTYDKTIKNFYVAFTAKPSNSNSRLLHRYILNPPKGLTVDHINRNTLDNRKENLRICTQFINNQNQSHNKSGKVGVCFINREKKYMAYIRVNGKMINLGTYKNFEDAVKSRIKAEIKYFKGGE